MTYHKWRRCPDCVDQMHDLYDWPANHRRPEEALCAPSVISDSLPDLFHPQSNRIHDSKSNFRKDTRSWGGIEKGNEKTVDKRWVDKPTGEEIHIAKQMVDQGYKPKTRAADKHDMASIIP